MRYSERKMLKTILCILSIFYAIYCVSVVNCDNGYTTVTNWKYHFPSGSGMGIYAALALPVPDSGNIDLFCAVFFEAYYSLPYNETSFEFPPSVDDRSFGRRSIYESIQAKLESRGYPGKSCVLKAICEAASYTTLHANGIVGDLMHLLLTPSATKERNESYFLEYKEAEQTGWEQQNCEKYNDCHVNLLNFLSFIE